MFSALKKFSKPVNNSSINSVYINNDGIAIVNIQRSKHSSTIPVNFICFIKFNDKPTYEFVASELDRVVRENDLKNIPTICVLSREMYRLLLIDVPTNISKGELQEASKWIIKDLIDFPMDDLASDSFLLPKLTDQAQKAYVCITKKHMLKIRQQQIISAELQLKRMTIADLALCYLMQESTDNKLNLIISYSKNHPTLLLTMNRALCLKHDIDQEDQHKEQDLNNFAALSSEIEKLMTYYTNNLDFKPNIQIIIMPRKGVDTLILDTISSTVPYPTKIFDITERFNFNKSISDDVIEQCIVPLGATLGEKLK